MKTLKRNKLVQENLRNARKLWGELSHECVEQLKSLSIEHGISVIRMDVLLLNGRWYVTHSGLLSLATRRKCAGIQSRPLTEFSDPSLGKWVFCATVYPKGSRRSFAGYGDACPSNVSFFVRGAEMRVAETRAVNRALRKAYGIGICSVEEIGSLESPSGPERPVRKMPPESSNGNNGNGTNGNGTRVRDRLCQIIRQHKLDAELVKSYAVDFCGTNTLRDASREQVESFVSHLADWAAKDRNALLCQLNSYVRQTEGAA